MATTFPTSIDSFTNPVAGNPMTSPDHATQHANANLAIEAIETFVGTTSARTATATPDLTVAASNSLAAVIAAANYVCTGTNDDVVINAALAALPATGGMVHLAAGDYYEGNTGILIANTGVTLAGAGREKASVIHVPASFSGAAGIKISNGGLSCGVRDLYMDFDNPAGVTAPGIWTLCNEPQISNVKIENAGGHGFLIDGASANTVYNGRIVNCEAVFAGSGTLADGFVATANAQSCLFTDCTVNGYLSYGAAALGTALTNGQTGITSLTVKPLLGAITNGDTLILNLPNFNTGASTTQLITASASAAAGATVISVNSFTANAAYGVGNYGGTVVADKTKMITRNGFSISGIDMHLTNCHAYGCYEAGLQVNSVGNINIFVVGGEFENNGWCNMNLAAVQQSIISGVGFSNYSCYAALRVVSASQTVVVGNYIDGQHGVYGAAVLACTLSTFSDNVVVNGVGSSGAICFIESCVRCTVVGNTAGYATLSGAGNSFTFYANTYSLFSDNNNTTATGYLVGGTNTGSIYKDNLGYNPVGSSVPGTAFAIGATTAAATNNTGVDGALYVTAAGTVTAVTVNGVVVSAVMAVGDTYRLAAGGTFKITYSVAPTIVFVGD